MAQPAPRALVAPHRSALGYTRGRMSRATVVVVTYDSEADVDRCFGSLARARAGGASLRVVAVDNASTDGTVRRLAERFPAVEVIHAGGNLGFAAGANLGIERARRHGAEYVYLLNPDTEVAPDFLERALEVADADPATAAVQSLLTLDPERELVDSAGNAIHFLGFGYCLEHRRPVASIDHAVREIPFASGAACLLRLAALDRTGTFAEELFLYCEDLDLGWRLRLAGFRNALAPRSIVFHHHDLAFPPAKHFFLERNRPLVLLRNLGAVSLAAVAPFFLINEVALFFVAWRQGWLRAKLAAWRALASPALLRTAVRGRRRAQSTRRVSDRELARQFAWRMEGVGARSSLALRIANPLFALLWPLLRSWYGSAAAPRARASR
jgi:GT2 family glycosyltransferase